MAKSIAQLGGGVAILDALPQPVDEFSTLAERYGVKTSYHQVDITDQNSLESAFKDAVNAMGQLHGAFTAAGIVVDGPSLIKQLLVRSTDIFTEKLTDADWENSRKVLDVNVLGTFWTAKLVSRHLIDTETPGSIVMVASLSAQGIHIPIQAVAIYNASKAAVKGLVGPLAVELGKHGIRVNCISPGASRTWIRE